MKSVYELGQTKKKGCTATSVLDVYHKGFLEGIELAANEYRNELENVVNELELSDIAIEKHGQLGTPPSELVRLVLQEIKEIVMYTVQLDGKAWVATGDGFINLHDSLAGYGDTPLEALAELLAEEKKSADTESDNN